MSQFKDAIIREAARPAEFAGFQFKVKPLAAIDGRKAMRQCARLFVMDPERDPTEVQSDLAIVLKSATQEVLDIIGIDPQTEPERLLFVFENWQLTQLAMCVITTEATLLELMEAMRESPTFRKLIHDTATGANATLAESEQLANNA